MRGFEARERHAVSRDGLLRVRQIDRERLRRPRNAGLLHRPRISEARLGPGLAANNAAEPRANHVPAWLDGMAGSALAKPPSRRSLDRMPSWSPPSRHAASSRP